MRMGKGVRNAPGKFVFLEGKEPMELCSTIIIDVHANKLSKKVKKISQRLAVGHAKKTALSCCLFCE